MPFHAPIPRKPNTPPGAQSGTGLQSGIGSLVEAEKLMQIAFLLPSATVIGWLLGLWADHLFRQKWIAIAGVVFGGIAGLVSVIRMAFDAEKKTPDLPRNETLRVSQSETQTLPQNETLGQEPQEATRRKP